MSEALTALMEKHEMKPEQRHIEQAENVLAQHTVAASPRFIRDVASALSGAEYRGGELALQLLGEGSCDYPNIESIASGCVSGEFREWPRVLPEARKILAEVSHLRMAAADFAALRAEAELSRRAEAETAETLNSVQQVLFDAGCFSATRSVVDNAKALRAERDAAVKRAEAVEALANHRSRSKIRAVTLAQAGPEWEVEEQQLIWAAEAAGCKLDGDA